MVNHIIDLPQIVDKNGNKIFYPKLRLNKNDFTFVKEEEIINWLKEHIYIEGYDDIDKTKLNSLSRK